MKDTAADLRLALRTLARTPIFTVVAIVSIAFGIGANTAIFTLLDQVILRSLPVKDPGRLVLLFREGSHHGSNRGSQALSYPMYEDFRDRSTVFDGVFCRYRSPLSFSDGRTTQRVAGELVSGSYFPVLGVQAALGRVLTYSDNLRPGEHPVAVISYGFWQTQFGGDPKIIGKEIRLNSYPFTIVGVTPRGFAGVSPGLATDIRVPLMMKKQMTPGWDDLHDRRSSWVNVFARLKPGISMGQVLAEADTIFHQTLAFEVKGKEFARATAYDREQFLKAKLRMQPAANGKSSVRERFAQPLYVLMTVAGLVLLIACANVANLMIARATGRQKEVAIRLALGARRRQIVRQLLAESLVLSLAGAAVGLGVAVVTVRLLLRYLDPVVEGMALAATPELRVFGFTLLAAVLSALLFGLAPALRTTRPDLASTLKDQAANLSGGVSHSLFRKGLVVAQVSLSLLLLIGAGLFIKSLMNLRTVNPGFEPVNIVAFDTDPALNSYPPARTQQLYRELLSRLRSTPGVRNAAIAGIRILTDDEWDSTVSVEGYDAKPGEDRQAFCNAIGPGYFATLGIPLLEGRDFSERDTGSDWTVAIVNQSFARHYFGNQSAVGRHVGFGGDPGTKLKMEIIGVVADAKYTALRDQVQRQLFISAYQADRALSMTTYVKTSLASAQMFKIIREQMHSVDANVPVYNIKSIEMQLDENLLRERLVAGLSSAFGVLATLLAVVGLYGVMDYTVVQRTREIGIRMAIGAVRGRVLWLVMKEVILVTVTGLALGLPVAFAAAKLVRTQLYGLEPTDLGAVLGAAGLLFLVACLAGYLPAAKASKIDPLRALRYE